MPATRISAQHAEKIASANYNLHGAAQALPGEIDCNFLIKTESQKFILKVSRPTTPIETLTFQNSILNHLAGVPLITPEVISDINENQISSFTSVENSVYPVRLLTWVEGTLWSDYSPITNTQLRDLGRQAGSLTDALQGFQHEYALREFDWDISQGNWVNSHLYLFDGERRDILLHFIRKFEPLTISSLRKAVVHNDVNDNNIVLNDGRVKAIIDFGDAIETEIINDAAAAMAYALMHKPDPLGAARAFLEGYQLAFPLLDAELDQLYTRIGMRLVISVTKSALNVKKDPENEYLQVSDKAAWDLLARLYEIPEALATAHFRKACGYPAHRNYNSIVNFLVEKATSIKTLIPTINPENVGTVDMSIGSLLFDFPSVLHSIEIFGKKLNSYASSIGADSLINGYLEVRPFYSTPAYQREGNDGPEYRTVHLGVDFWAEASTAIHSPLDGVVHSIHDNKGDKDYGPTVILSHSIEGNTFHSLYGHMSASTLNLLETGQEVVQGQLIGWLGCPSENGGWVPHLHFQLMLDLMGNTHDFPGVSFPNEASVWADICPSPHLLFTDVSPSIESTESEMLIERRKKVLGRSMSISYNSPLTMLRGEGAYLIDRTGRKYLDTVNNVAHVGHEHPGVVRAGQQQMGVLNTNTRYLHPNVVAFAERLVSTMPPDLNVVHLVNSGSEANELALRMAYTVTGQRDILAVEVGYHGNTTGTVDISSYKFDGKGGMGAPQETHVLPLPDSYRGLYQGTDTASKYAGHADEIIADLRKQGKSPAGFICESILSCGGQIELPRDYLKKVYDTVRSAGGLCIADEVQVGCGRTGSHFWAFEAQDVVPDIVTIGKPIGNGHPLAAVVCTAEVAEAFANGMEYFNTFGGNPVSSAIGLEVLNVIEEENLQEHARNVGGFLKKGLESLKSKYDCIGDVRGRGFFLGFELCTTDKTPLPEHASYLANRARDLGILMSTDGPDHNVIKIKPPMVFSMANALELLQRLDGIFSETPMKVILP